MWSDLVGYLGHEVHLSRFREARTLLSWLEPLEGQRLLDVAGGDGYWAERAHRRGAESVCLDLSMAKLQSPYSRSRRVVQGDALRLPFADATFDSVLSICAIEHFLDGPAALDEMARVLRPGGHLAMSADVLSRGLLWPDLEAVHRRKYAVHETYDHSRLTFLLAERGLTVDRYNYLFRGIVGEHLYLAVSAKGGKAGWNAAAPLLPLLAWDDARRPNIRGSVVLVRATKPPSK
jgi:ubiquinone/menaquinone biosynthesis C-methylase UbiE